MRKATKRKICMVFFFVIALCIGGVGNLFYTEAAKAPKFNVKTKEFLAIGKEYQIQIYYKPKGGSYDWTSSNEDVATVDYRGIVTSVAPGTTTVRCKVKAPKRKTRTLSCKVTVRVPAKSIVISNKNLTKNNTHQIQVGDTYDFNRKLSPKISSDKTYWKIKDTDIATVDSMGVVTAKKIGITKLTATAAKSRSQISKSIVNDAVILSVVARTAKVESIQLVDSKKITIAFSDPINKSTVIDLTTKLLKDTVRIVVNNTKNVNSVEPGRLSATLSSDLKTLTIVPEYYFNGTYEVKVNAGVLTTTNVKVATYKKTVSLKDTGSPKLVQVRLDDSGVLCYIDFNEPMRKDGLQIISVKSGTATLGFATRSVLQNPNNYQLSADRKTLKLDLTGIDSADENRAILVELSGMKDLAGNATNPETISITVKKDTTLKPQARLVSVERSGRYMLTATFTRAIKETGYAYLNGEALQGVVDSEDTKKVNYTLTSMQSALTGWVEFMIGGWNAYYVSETDPSITQMQIHKLYFAMNENGPKLVTSHLETTYVNQAKIYQLILNYDKPVVLAGAFTGILNATVFSSKTSTISDLELNYTASIQENVVTLMFDTGQLGIAGNYQVIIPEGFVLDSYELASKIATVQFVTADSETAPLEAPVIEQDSNPSYILVTYPTKVDPYSAQLITNYSVEGNIPQKAELLTNESSKAIVRLTMGDGIIRSAGNYTVSVEAVKSYAGDRTLSKVDIPIWLRPNKAPTLVSSVVYETSIELTFSSELIGTPSYTVTRADGKILNSSVYIVGDQVSIYLWDPPTETTMLYITPNAANHLTDADGNPVAYTPVQLQYIR